MNNIRFQRFLLFFIMVAAFLSLSSDLKAQDGEVYPDLENELIYITKLQELRMPDIAEVVIAEAKRKWPDAAARLKVLEFQGFLWQGKFSEVKSVIDAMPDKNSAEYWALNLALADGYYAYHEFANADKLYLDFFKKNPKPSKALTSFYLNAAYKYAQMLIYLGKDAEALVAYGRLFKVKIDEDRKRNVYAEMAELMLKLAPDIKDKTKKKAMLKKADNLVDKLLWLQDVWFGKAIVMKAHIYMLRDDVKGAQELVEEFMPQLKVIHNSLLKQDPDGSKGWLRMSPMPECRYLLAALLLDEAKLELKKSNPDDERIKALFLGPRTGSGKRKGNGAFNHLINVFIRFPESQWAADAGERSEEIRAIIKKRYGVELRTPVTTEQMQRVQAMQFAGANLLFSQNKFKEAAEKYLMVLNQFPESREAVNALANLALCYIDSSDKSAYAQLMADTVIGHLSERFAGDEKLMKAAGNQLRSLADNYGTLGRDDKRRETYALFFRDYPKHFAVSQLLMSFAGREYDAGNYPGAMAYYERIANEYKDSNYYYGALTRITQIYKTEQNPTKEIRALDFLITELQQSEKPGHNLPVAQFRLAEAHRSFGNNLLKTSGTNETVQAALQEGAQLLAKAALEFGEVAKLLADDATGVYHKNGDERKVNQQIREMATFTKGVALSQMRYPVANIPVYRKHALNAFKGFLKTYPESKYAPKALLQIGTLYTVMKDKEGSQKAFEDLSKRYPDSVEAKNSVPELASALIEMGLRGEGVAKYREMFIGSGKYSSRQYSDAAEALLNAEEYVLALEGYEKVLTDSKELALTARAKLGKARALMGQNKYSEARKMLALFITDPKLSGLSLAVDANMLLAEAASQEGQTEADNDIRKDLFNQAVNALKLAGKYLKGKTEIAEINQATGEMLVRKMKAEKKLGLADQAVETRGKAIVAFMRIVDSINPGDAALAPYLERAYYTYMPMLLEQKNYEQAVEDCESYLKLFPAGRYKTDINNWLNQAKIGLQ